ncbi:MAG: DNA repair exonuclease [Candidatus Bathyarchaeia archaeon]
MCSALRSFSFVHLADLHLGYTQYNLIERREDFSKAFIEAAEKILKLKPSFVIISGDMFDNPRPPNTTLATAVRVLRKLREAGIPVLAVEGSHDMEPNVITGTILIPLHNAGLIIYLPKLEGACWRNDECYVYGLRNFRSLREADEKLPQYYEKAPPKPHPDLFNIFAFHGTVDKIPSLRLSIQPEIRVDQIPEGFQYYAGGHLHVPVCCSFKGGVLAYPGCLETTSYDEAYTEKGFFHVMVSNRETAPEVERIKNESARPFRVLEKEFSGMLPDKITEEACRLLAENDGEGDVIILILRGLLPTSAKRSQIDIPKIISIPKKALYVKVLNQLIEVAAEKTLKLRETRELKTLAYNYFLDAFSKRMGEEEGKKIATCAIDLLEPLLSGEEPKVKAILEGVIEN